MNKEEVSLTTQRRVLEIAAVAVAYYLAARLGLLLALAKTNASPVWPSSGIALAAVLLIGARVWPGIALGAFGANLVVLLANQTAEPFRASLVSACIALGNMLEALVAVQLLRRWVLDGDPFDRGPNVFRFVAVVAIGSAVSAGIGSTSLAIAGIISWDINDTVRFTWWLGDAAGILVLTPFALAWRGGFRVRWDSRRWFEAAALFGLLVIAVRAGYGGDVFTAKPYRPLGFFITLPFLVWAAFRFGMRGATTAILTFTSIAIWETTHGHGLLGGTPVNQALLRLQVLTLVSSATILAMTAMVREQRNSTAKLQQAYGLLETWVEERTQDLRETNEQLRAEVTARIKTEEALRHSESKFRAVADTANDGIITADNKSRIVYFNKAAERIFGFAESEVLGQPVSTLMPERYHRVHQAGIQRYLATGKPHVVGKTTELVGRRKDGAEFPLELSLATWQFGPEVFFTGVVRDITKRRLAEDGLRRNQALLAGAEQIAHFGSWEWNIPTNTVTWSEELYQIYGLNPSAARASHEVFLELVHPDDREHLLSAIEEGYRSRKPFSYYHRIIRPDGLQRVMHGRGEVFVDAQGRPVRLAGTGQDVTEQVRAEELRSYYVSLVESTADAVVGCSPAGSILTWNSAAEKIFGYPAEEMKGQSLRVMIPAERRAEYAKILKRVERGERVENFQTEHRRKDGRLIDVSITVSPIKDSRSQLIGISTIARDITAQVRSEKRFRALLESAPDAMVIMDQRSEIVLLNSQTVKLFGYSREELLGQRVEMLMPERFATRHVEHRAGYTSEAHMRPMGVGLELFGRRKNGTEFPVEISLSPIETAEGMLVTAAIRDITERKRLEQEVLVVSEREQRRIGEDLHDGLCQHLAGIDCMTRVLHQRLANKSVREATTAAKISELLHDSIGEARRLAQGLFPVKLEANGLMSALEGLAGNIHSLFGVSCRFDCDRSVLIEKAETATNLFRIAQEAASNAVKHGKARHIVIALTGTRKYITLTIRNDGVAFPQNLPTSEGLGMRIMHHRAGIIGATLNIKRAGPRGTIVTVSLPRTVRDRGPKGNAKQQPIHHQA